MSLIYDFRKRLIRQAVPKLKLLQLDSATETASETGNVISCQSETDTATDCNEIEADVTGGGSTIEDYLL